MLSGYIPFNLFGKSEPAPKLSRFDSSETLASLRSVVKKIHDKCDSLQKEFNTYKDALTENKLKDLKYIIRKVDEEIKFFNENPHKTINVFLSDLIGSLCYLKSDSLGIPRDSKKEIAKNTVDAIFGEKADDNTYTGYLGNRLKDIFGLHSKEPESQELYKELTETIYSIAASIPRHTLK